MIKTKTGILYRQTGVTIIEVMVGMFILALGILALLGMQTRTLGTIKQAQNVVSVSQAVDNLAQGLTINPQLKLILTRHGYVTKKDYAAYRLDNCTNRTSELIHLNSTRSKQELATQQLNQFCQEINQITSISPNDLQLKVCTNSRVDETLDWNFTCHQNGTETVVKVVWKYQTKTESQDNKDDDNNQNNARLIDREDNKITLFYQVPITE